jgi:hypothetical protein
LISDKKKYMEWIKTAKKQFERFRYEFIGHRFRLEMSFLPLILI